MKKIVSLLFVFLIVVTVLSSCKSDVTYTDYNSQEQIEEVESDDSLSTQLGVSMLAPSTARDVKATLINKLIGQVEFSFNSILYVYRGSKVMNGTSLHKKKYDSNTEVSVNIGDRATVKLYIDEDGGRVAEWFIDGTYYSLTSVKGVTDDNLTELLDLLIK